MPKEDIIRGLEGAMAKGESLENAMYSFYNAGYKKEEVEEAARALSVHLSSQESLVATPIPNISKEIKNPVPKILEPMQMPKPTLTSIDQLDELSSQQANVVQDVSKYEAKPKMQPRTVLVILLSVLLVVLLGALIGIFVFRDALLGFFNKFM